MARVTMQDIARASGFSRSTVSRALKDHPSIPEKTAKKIKRLAKDLGYRPNPLVSALLTTRNTQQATRSITTIAYLDFFPGPNNEPAPSVLRSFTQGAHNRCQQLGFKLERFWINEPGMTPKRLGEILRARGILGFILGPSVHGDTHFDFKFQYFASATIAYSIASPDLHRASTNHFQSMLTALKKMNQMGYQRVGFAVEYEVEKKVGLFYSAAYRIHQESNVPKNELPIFRYKNAPPKNDLIKWLKKTKADSVISLDNRIPIMLIDSGVAIPTDIGFASLSVDSLPQLPKKRVLTGISQRSNRVGAAAADLVIAQLYRNETGIPVNPKTVLTPGHWKDGNTTRRM
ncbi:MAG: LacI family DNA-binding transcriptional regulator [Verrucomicrobiota bacterium]